MRVNLSEKGGNRVIRIEIRPEEAGRRVLRFLEIILPGAPKSFLFKALRQNKFKINGRHARDEKAVLKAGDVVECYLTDEQLSDFGYGKAREEKSPQKKLLLPGKIRIVYEDKDLLVVDKPAGIATQKSSRDDISLTEIMRDRILSENREQSSYHPSFCHRLDKNTSGLLIMAKTLEAHQAVSRMLEERLVRKYYLAIVCGTSTAWEQETRLIHRYEKNERQNKAVLSEWKGEGSKCECIVRMINHTGDRSLIRIELLSGKSHQIRAQLAYEGFPIENDGKYNDESRQFCQSLCAYELFFEKSLPPLQKLEGKRFFSDLPDRYKKLFPET